MPIPSLRFTSRTAHLIREDLIGLIPELAPSWTSHGEDEPGIALIDMLAGVADGLHYYFDKQALETFIPTVRLRKNAFSLAHLLGYRPRRTLAAQGTLRILTTQTIDYPIFIPAKTQFQTDAGLPLITLESVMLPANFSGLTTLPAVQGDPRQVTLTSPGGHTFDLPLPDQNPSEQAFEVTTYDQPWVEFRDSQPEDPDNRWYHYFETLNGQPKIGFRRSLGNTPIAGTPIIVTYLLSQDVSIVSATPVQTPDIATPDGLSASEASAHALALSRLKFETGTLQGYRPRESVSRLRYSAPLSIKTKHRAVSASDYELLARQIGGVKAVKTLPSNLYMRQVVAYVLMEDGTDPSGETLATIQAYLDQRNDLTLDVEVEPAPLQPFRCTIKASPTAGYTSAEAVYDAREALSQFLRTTAATFGRRLRIGEIYNIATQPDSVAFINLEALYWDGQAVGVGDLEPESDLHVPTIGERLLVGPVTS